MGTGNEWNKGRKLMFINSILLHMSRGNVYNWIIICFIWTNAFFKAPVNSGGSTLQLGHLACFAVASMSRLHMPAGPVESFALPALPL